MEEKEKKSPKKKAAAAFNKVVENGAAAGVDKRTLAKIERIKAELRGPARDEMTPIQLLQKLQQLHGYGCGREAMKTKPLNPLWQKSEEAARVLKDVHEAYGFELRVYRAAGVEHALLVAAGITKARREPKAAKTTAPRAQMEMFAGPEERPAAPSDSQAPAA